MRHLVISLAALAVPAAAVAAGPGDFTCANRQAQISCNGAACEVETASFTPMSVSRSGNRLEVCAYTGCWSGPLDLVRTRGDLVILHARLSGGQGTASVTYDRRQKIATMLWGNFAQAMSCGEAP
ncbi:hypothetical protein [Erythrobacter oryzae]|uniref:hypothetical protein n=1 Tax=Erythrobacter oryzae TaxID=3019556 RepID=UPI002552F281|nr:hypothetical protein [Erythrobacter sp. COR-2]